MSKEREFICNHCYTVHTFSKPATREIDDSNITSLTLANKVADCCPNTALEKTEGHERHRLNDVKREIGDEDE